VHVPPGILRRMSKGDAQCGPVQIPTPIIHFAAYSGGAVVSFPEITYACCLPTCTAAIQRLSVTETGDRKVDADT